MSNSSCLSVFSSTLAPRPRSTLQNAGQLLSTASAPQSRAGRPLAIASQRHDDAVVVVAGQRCVRRVERHALDVHGGAVHLDARAHLSQLGLHGLDAVRFLQAQAARIADDRLTAAKAAERKEDRP